MRTRVVRQATGLITALLGAVLVVITSVPPAALAIVCRDAPAQTDPLEDERCGEQSPLQRDWIDGATGSTAPEGAASSVEPPPAADLDSGGGLNSPDSTVVSDGNAASSPTTLAAKDDVKSPPSTTAPAEVVQPAPAPSGPEADVGDPTATSTTGPDAGELSTSTTLLGPPDSVPHIGLIPPISVVRPPPAPRETSGPASVAPVPAPVLAPATTMQSTQESTVVAVLGVQVTRQQLPVTGLDSRSMALLALAAFLAGSAFLAWGGRHTSDNL